jgi:hypothetical protein
MKTMTCKQLGGACELEFHANTFEEMAEISKKHGMEMFQKGDKPHLKAMEHIKKFMNNPKAMKDWMKISKKNLKHYLRTNYRSNEKVEP